MANLLKNNKVLMNEYFFTLHIWSGFVSVYCVGRFVPMLFQHSRHCPTPCGDGGADVKKMSGIEFIFNFFKRKYKVNSMGIMNSNFLFHEKGIIDVTDFAAMSPEDSLGYMCGCTIIVSSDGTIRVCEHEDENVILETIAVENIIRFNDNINSYDPSRLTEVSLMTKDHGFHLSFESVKVKKRFADTLKAL